MRKQRERFLPAEHEWPGIRDQYVTLIRAGYSAEEASKAVTTRWFTQQKEKHDALRS
jgi:hypothetical protein